MSAQRSEQSPSASANPGKSIPKDAQVITAILKEFGITEYDPKIINQLLDYSYRYTVTVLEDAKLYANHAKKKNIETDDVKVAISMQADQVYSGLPTRDVLLELARQKNSIPLPNVKAQTGVKLPPERYCLLQGNYRLKTSVGAGVKRKNGPSKSQSGSSLFASKDKHVPPAVKQMATTVPSSTSSSPVFNIADIKFSADDDK